jgi:ATP-dependent Zn protease
MGKPVEEVDYDHLAARTDGFSGADLSALVENDDVLAWLDRRH